MTILGQRPDPLASARQRHWRIDDSEVRIALKRSEFTGVYQVEIYRGFRGVNVTAKAVTLDEMRDAGPGVDPLYRCVCSAGTQDGRSPTRSIAESPDAANDLVVARLIRDSAEAQAVNNLADVQAAARTLVVLHAARAISLLSQEKLDGRS